MRYKLITGSLNNIFSPKETVLLNRGIENPKEYLNLNDSCLHDWRLLDNIEDARDCVLKHLENKSNIHIVVDSDCDGNTSAAMMYNYLKLLDPNVRLSYSIHTKKQHGLSDDIVIPKETNLLIVPDAGTNDKSQCAELKKQGIDIVILDHHMPDGELTEDAILVNCQLGDYPNKALSGAGVVYKLLQAIDEETWNEYADNFLDLCALSLIGDCMDIKSYETKRLIDKGIKRIENKMFKTFVEKQSYSMNNTVNITSIQWYIVPLINAMIRAGSDEEKDMMFRAFIEEKEVFKYKPRRKSKTDPEPEEIDEDICTRVARLCSNAKGRQGKSREKGGDKIDEIIIRYGLDKNKVLFANVTDVLEDTLTGVVAIKVAERYNRPCVLLKRKEDGSFGGSGRNLDGSPIEDLKGFLESTGLFDFVSGHNNAFGVGIQKENIPLAIEKTNELLKNEDFSHCYAIDFLIDSDDLDIRLVKELDSLKEMYGQGLSEARIMIENIKVNKEQVELIGKDKNTWKFLFNDEIAFVKFKNNEDDEILSWVSGWDDIDCVVMDVIGKASINHFGSILTPQIVIEKYELRKE